MCATSWAGSGCGALRHEVHDDAIMVQYVDAVVVAHADGDVVRACAAHMLPVQGA